MWIDGSVVIIFVICLELGIFFGFYLMFIIFLYIDVFFVFCG